MLDFCGEHNITADVAEIEVPTIVKDDSSSRNDFSRLETPVWLRVRALGYSRRTALQNSRASAIRRAVIEWVFPSLDHVGFNASTRAGFTDAKKDVMSRLLTTDKCPAS